MTDTEKNYPFNNVPPFPLWSSGQFHHGYLPWYNDRADFNTNAPSYYDYLARFNGEFISSFIDSINDLLKRDVNVSNSSTIELTKTGDWQKTPKGDSEITLGGNILFSTQEETKTIDFVGSTTIPNGSKSKDDGLYSPDYLDVLNKLGTGIDALQKQLDVILVPEKKFLKFNRTEYVQDGNKELYDTFDVGLSYYKYSIKISDTRYQIIEGIAPSLIGCKIVDAPKLAILGTLSNDILTTQYGFTNQILSEIGNNTAGFAVGYFTLEGRMLLLGLRQRDNVFQITLEGTTYPADYPVNVEMQEVELQYRNFIHYETSDPFE